MNNISQSKGWLAHTHLLGLALPMILANVTTPLLGLVDTAVLGRMESSAMLAGASIGALILTQTYWLCGFLRMSTTGLSAQAKGAQFKSSEHSAKVLCQSLSFAIILALVILLSSPLLFYAGSTLANPGQNVYQFMHEYFFVRVWGAPAAMLNLVLVGFLVGQQKTKAVLIIQVVGNLLNALLDIFCVYILDMGVEGVAAASVVAEYTMAVLAVTVCWPTVAKNKLQANWLMWIELKKVFFLNNDMFIRNLALQVCIAFLTLQGARIGELEAAVNAILMQFFVLIALGLDGIAYAVEALVGEAKGAKNKAAVRAHTYRGLLWSSLFAVAYSFVFGIAGNAIIQQLTTLPQLREAAQGYLYLMILLPLIGHWCFLFDGVYIGLTQSKEMRNTMLVSALGVFFPVWWGLQELGNVALWLAMLAFLGARGFTLGLLFWRNEVVVSRRAAI